MLKDNLILQSAEEYISTNCVIFNERAFITFLQLMLNEPEFVEKITNLSPLHKMNYIRELEAEYNISLDNTTKYLQKVIDEQDAISKIMEMSDAISQLHSQFLNDRSGEEFAKIKTEVEGIENNLKSVYNPTLNDEAKSRYLDLSNTILKFKGELDSILDTFMTDEGFRKTFDNMFKQNRIWASRYGNSSCNPYFEKRKEKTDLDLTFKPFVKCQYLKCMKTIPMASKTFTPLTYTDTVYISEDGRSISVYNGINSKINTIELDDDIISSGAIMFLKNTKYLVVCCKNEIKVLNDNGIFWSAPYKTLMDDNCEVKSITAFNNTVYINITNYTSNTTIIYILRYDFYQKKISIRQPITLTDRIMSNITVLYDYANQIPRVCYITRSGVLYFADANSFDITSTQRIDSCPLDYFYKVTNPKDPTQVAEIRYNFPVVSHDGDLYYIGLDRMENLCLFIYSPTETEVKKVILPPLYVRQKGDNGIFPGITNIVVGDDRVALDGYLQGTYVEVKLDNKQKCITKQNNMPKKKNDFILGFTDTVVRLEESVPAAQTKYSKLRVVGSWQGRTIVAGDSPDGYQLFVEE